MYTVTWRDKLTHKIANTVIEHVATEDYRNFLIAIYALGLEEFDNRFWELYTVKEQRKHQDYTQLSLPLL